jgi:hypothetical protein
MSARQPFLPSRPASRALNRGDDTSTTSGGNARAALPSNPPSDTNDSAEFGVKINHSLPSQKVILTPNQPENHSRTQHLRFQKTDVAHYELRCRSSRLVALRPSIGRRCCKRPYAGAHICASSVHPTHRTGIPDGGRVQNTFAAAVRQASRWCAYIAIRGRVPPKVSVVSVHRRERPASAAPSWTRAAGVVRTVVLRDPEIYF